MRISELCLHWFEEPIAPALKLTLVIPLASLNYSTVSLYVEIEETSRVTDFGDL